MKNQMKNLIESEKSSEDITQEFSEGHFPPRTASDIRDFLAAAEEVRIAAQNDPDLDNIVSKHLGGNWKAGISSLISELDSEI